MDFERERRDWPNSDQSRFVATAGLRWHVQVAGEGPCVLFVHGTGASTHSWRQLVPLLAKDYTLVMPDLPGHAFTQAPSNSDGFTLRGMAGALAELMRALQVAPAVAVGHSAGAAILIRAVLDHGLAPRALVSLNGALFPFGGAAGTLFSPLAKLMASMSWVPRFMSWRARDRKAVAKLLRDLGSKPSDEDVGFYTRLFSDDVHVASTLAMMANWDLRTLVRDMPNLGVPVTLVAGLGDKAVPPQDAERVARMVPKAKALLIAGGHLAHEERAELVAPIIRGAAAVAQTP